MFVNCPHCQSLVAVDAVTGTAPEHCPYCDGAMSVAMEEPDADVNTDLDTDVDTDLDTDLDTEAEADAYAESDAVEVASVDSDVSTLEILRDGAAGIQAPADDGDQVSNVQPAADPQALDDTSAQALQSAPAARKRRKKDPPSFAKRPAASEVHAHNARWPWPVAASLLLLLLLQLVVADRASLAAHPRWRVAITNVCNALRCEIPPWRETGAFTMLARDVHAHPGVADALRIRAAFRNDARWPQPWPQLVVTLSDASGRVTGSRTFTADEYLGDVPTQKLIATGQTAAVALEIREPAPNTVSFSFDFR